MAKITGYEMVSNTGEMLEDDRFRAVAEGLADLSPITNEYDECRFCDGPATRYEHGEPSAHDHAPSCPWDRARKALGR